MYRGVFLTVWRSPAKLPNSLMRKG